jgi:hypothetical protein
MRSMDVETPGAGKGFPTSEKVIVRPYRTLKSGKCRRSLPAHPSHMDMASIRPPPTMLSMKVAISRFVARCDPALAVDDSPSAVERLEAEIAARDDYIQNLAARNLLLRMRVQELKWAVKRLRGKSPT